jgi:hypothetical protein
MVKKTTLNTHYFCPMTLLSSKPSHYPQTPKTPEIITQKLTFYNRRIKGKERRPS